MSDALKAPVVLSLNETQMASYTAFMERLRNDGSIVAGLEAERLKPYLAAFSKQLLKDIGKAPKKAPSLSKRFITANIASGGKADMSKIVEADLALQRAEEERKALTALATATSLHKLFNAVTASSGNAILSEIVVAPEGLLSKREVLADATTFDGRSSYAGISFTLGFIQAFNKVDKTSTSFPVLAFNDEMMQNIEKYAPEKMFRHFQAVMTAGNHDMQHHYSNRILNSAISKTEKGKESSHFKAYTVKKWFDEKFSYSSDEQPESYESWLMLNHMRVRRIMEKGPEGRKLQAEIDGFFDELTRIGGEMAAVNKLSDALIADMLGESLKAANDNGDNPTHKTIDYFGSMLGFALMRFMPLDHPMFEHAMKQLEKADPYSHLVTDGKQGIVNAVSRPNHYIEKAAENYSRKGTDLLADSDEYFRLKRMQLMVTAPWIVHLLSAAQPDTTLAEMQSRVGGISRDMIKAAAISSAFYAGTGKREIKNGDCNITAWHENDRLHRIGGTAYVETGERDTRKEQWYQNGLLHRDDGPAETIIDAYGNKTERWYQNGKLHREDGPAEIEESSSGKTIKRWYNQGVVEREGGPAETTTYKNKKSFKECWYKNGVFHRDDGPAAIIYSEGSGETEQLWYQNGVRHRVGGPAEIRTGTNDSSTEKWYENNVLLALINKNPNGTGMEIHYDKNGSYHREDGPAYIEITASSREESWYKHGSYHREGGPAQTRTNTDGSSTEEWMVNNLYHRTDGTALLIVYADGSRKDVWYTDGVVVKREETPAPSKKPVRSSKKRQNAL